MSDKSPVLIAKREVARFRNTGETGRLAEALEGLASALIKEADLIGAAAALEEASGLWSKLSSAQRQGNCLLLAASSRRLAGDLQGAQRNVDLGLAASLPPRIRAGFEAEWCEQELANGRYENAYAGFTRVLERVADELEPARRAQLYQRRAAAAAGGQQYYKAADDFLHSSAILKQHSFHADAEVSALAAAALLADVDPESAERVVSTVSETVPSDGAAAARRGLVGGRIAMQAGLPALALERFDAARQGALDVGDPVSYHAASVEASHVAESIGRFDGAYARLATAWASLSDVLGPETAALMIRPEMKGLQNRLGTDIFAAAKRDYERKRQL